MEGGDHGAMGQWPDLSSVQQRLDRFININIQMSRHYSPSPICFVAGHILQYRVCRQQGGLQGQSHRAGHEGAGQRGGGWPHAG